MGTLSVDKLVKTSTGAAEFTLPATDGTAGQVWQTDGSGQLSAGNISGISVAATTLTASGATTLSGATTVSGAFTSLGIDDNAVTTAITIDGSQNVSVPQKIFVGGATTSIPVSNGQQNWVQQHEASNRGGTTWFSTHNSSASAESVFAKGRSGTLGNFTIVQDNDNLGRITWGADDGVDMNSVAAQLSVQIDGTPGANDTPGRMTFATTPDGSASPTEKLRINSVGNMILSGSGSVGISYVTIADDAVASFTPGSNRGMIFAGGSSTHMGAAGYVCINGGSQESYLLLNSAGTFAVGTGVPTGTTGTDVRFNIFAASDGKIYFENRLGGSFTVWYFTMGLPW